MLQTDVDLAFQTTGAWLCGKVSGQVIKGLSFPKTNHQFATHIWEFTSDEEGWHEEFTMAWGNLTSIVEVERECAMNDSGRHWRGGPLRC